MRSFHPRNYFCAFALRCFPPVHTGVVADHGEVVRPGGEQAGYQVLGYPAQPESAHQQLRPSRDI